MTNNLFSEGGVHNHLRDESSGPQSPNRLPHPPSTMLFEDCEVIDVTYNYKYEALSPEMVE